MRAQSHRFLKNHSKVIFKIPYKISTLNHNISKNAAFGYEPDINPKSKQNNVNRDPGTMLREDLS